jgi:hypothetical protein
MSYAFGPAGRRSESVTTLFAEEPTAPEFARFVNAQSVGEVVADAAAFDLNRLGSLK